MKIFVLTLLCVISLKMISAFPSGAPKCTSLKPKHKGAKAQTSESPFKLVTTLPKKSADGKLILKVSLLPKNDSTKFRGFILYANAPSSDAKIGTFVKTTGINTLTCDGNSGNAVTHIDREDKNSLVVEWIAPNNFSGPVKFKATVVKELQEFWTEVSSPEVQI